MRTAIRGLVNAASRAATRKPPRPPDGFPHRRVHRARIARVHHQTDCSRVVVHEQYFRPGFTAVCGLENATVGIGGEHMPQASDINNVWVLWIDEDCADRVRVAQAGILPRFAGVGRFEESVARNNRVADVRFAGADV